MNIRVTTSIEARLNRHYAAVSARLRGQPKRIMLKVEPQEPKPVRVDSRDQQTDFIKARCQHMSIGYRTIMDECVSGHALKVRDQILLDVRKRWPVIQYRRLAELFNRDVAAIRDLLASFQVRSPHRPITPEAVKEMQRMRDAGAKYAEIAQVFGVSDDTVGYHLGKKR